MTKRSIMLRNVAIGLFAAIIALVSLVALPWFREAAPLVEAGISNLYVEFHP